MQQEKQPFAVSGKLEGIHIEGNMVELVISVQAGPGAIIERGELNGWWTMVSQRFLWKQNYF